MAEETIFEDNSAQLALLVQNVTDYAIYMLDLDGRVCSWNTGAERLKGYSRAEIIGHHFSRFYTPEEQNANIPRTALETARREGRFAAEGWRVRKDGSHFFASVVIDAIHDREGQLVGFAKITRDVTEREETQRKLLESERRYRLLVDSVVDYAIFQLDPSGIITTWNNGAQRIKGYSAEQIVGHHFSVFYTPEDRQEGVPEQALRTARDEGRFEAEGWRVKNDGSRFWANVVIDRILDENGKLLGFAKVTRDATERREAAIRLKEVEQQLAASQKMEAVGQLSGGIAHDFNNLLMIVLGNLESASRQVKQIQNVNLSRYISNAMRGAQRASALTSRLLAFSRRQPLDPKPLDVNKYLVSAVDFIQRTLGENIEIEAVGGAGIWPIEVDANQLESALINLAINARDAMPNGGKLTLEASNVYADEEYVRATPELEPGQYVVLCVSDTGSGMPADVVSRAFEPFFTTKEIGRGTGLGLSQVYGFVRQSDGLVKIYSEVGEGTTIKLYFPRLFRAAENSDKGEIEALAEANISETILLVEDDADLRAYLSDVLQNLNYHVLAAKDAQAALAFLQQDDRSIDLMLTDVVMPGIGGRELARRAHKIRPNLPVLYMTGYSRNAIVHQGRLDKGVEFVQKPISQATLAARIREILDNNPQSGQKT